jgi:hypothetical protein
MDWDRKEDGMKTRKKMSLAVLKSFYGVTPVIPGDPNERTKATTKGHVHNIGKSARPSKGCSSHVQRRKDKWRRFAESLKG